MGGYLSIAKKLNNSGQILKNKGPYGQFKFVLWTVSQLKKGFTSLKDNYWVAKKVKDNTPQSVKKKANRLTKIDKLKKFLAKSTLQRYFYVAIYLLGVPVTYYLTKFVILKGISNSHDKKIESSVSAIKKLNVKDSEIALKNEELICKMTKQKCK